MKAVVLERPGRLEVRDVAGLGDRKQNEAVVRVHSVGVCGTDLHAFRGDQPFFTYPRILGHELGVEVMEVGENEMGLKVSDRCALEPYLNCGHCVACRRGKPNCCAELQVLGVHVDGGMRELLSVPVQKLHSSEELSFDQLALTEMLGIGMHAVERAELRADDTVLVAGAGPIGLAVMEFLRLVGLEYSVMDVNEKRLAYCRKTIGPEHCLDANSEPEERLRNLNQGDLPTVVFDCTGNLQSMSNAFHYVAHGGKLIYVGLITGQITFDDPFFHSHEITLYSSRNSTGLEFHRILRLIENGVIDVRRWITHRVPYTRVADQLPHWLSGQDEFRKAIVEW